MNSIVDRLSVFVDSLSNRYRAGAFYLSGVRILFALHVLLFPIDWTWMARVPAAFFHPRPGFFQFVHEPPTMNVVLVLSVLRALFALVILVGFQTFSASIALSAVLISGAGLSYSYGKLDHFILYESFPIFMAFAGWGAALSLDSRRHPVRTAHGFPMLLWAVTVAFALFTAALPKALGGWLNPAREASRGYIARDLADGQKVGALAPILMDVHSDVFWKSFDYATLFAEGWLVFAVFVPTFFRLGLALIVAFHIGVYLSLGIDFFAYLFLYLPFFAPVVDAVHRWLVRARVRRRVVAGEAHWRTG